MRNEPEFLEERVITLEETVAELEDRLDALEDADHAGDGPNGKRDRYDGEVLAQLEVGETYSLGTLRSLYKNAGVRSSRKIKSRLKHLVETGLLNRCGTQTWRFVGGKENE